MQATLDKMRRRGEEDRGFTMIELLVVVVIIGVLVAIAVPVYLNYRKGAANKSAQSDVRGAITTIEQFYNERSNNYPASFTAVGPPSYALLEGTAATTILVTVSPNNQLSFAPLGDGYVLCGQNKDGEDVYVYNSNKGGSVTKSSATTLATCITTG